MNAWEHPVVKDPGIMVVDEYCVNFFASLSKAQIIAQYSDAELADMYACGVRKIDFRLPLLEVVTDAAAGTYTLKAGVAVKLEGFDDIIRRWSLYPGTSGIMAMAHAGGSAGYTTAMSNATNFAACLQTIAAALPLAWANPRVMWAWAVEPNASGKTQAQIGKFNRDLAVALGASFTNRCWMMPTNLYSSVSDLATAVIWSTDGTTFAPPPSNVTARGAMYYPFFLTHLASGEADYVPGQVDSVAPDYPFTDARRLAMRTAVGAATWDNTGTSNPTRLSTDALATVGLGYPDILAYMNAAADFERKYSIPVIIEECGFAWRTGWGENCSQIAWFDDVIAAAETLNMRDRIGFFSKSPIAPSVVNFGVGFTTAVSTIVSVSKGVMRSITRGHLNVSSGEVAQISNSERSDGIAWTPESLSAGKLLAWYDFSLVAGADASAVSSASPRAGTITEAITSSGAARPTIAASIGTMNGMRGLSFTATQYLDSPTISRGIPFDVTMVCDPTINVTAGADRYTSYFDTPTGTTPRLGLGTLQNNGATTKNWFILNSGSVWIDYNVNANSVSWSNPQIAMARFSTTTNAGSIRISGNVIKTGQHTAGTWTKMRFGANLNGTDGLNGYVTDIVITTNLTADEVLRLEWWLAQRAGITLSGNKYSGSTPATL